MTRIVRKQVWQVVVVVVAGIVGVALCSAIGASQGEKLDASAELLLQMNKHYEKGEYEDVLRVGKKIEEIDKYGEKSGTTAAVYATMATCSMHLGRKAEKDGDSKAALAYFRRSAGYNRAFANSLMMHNKTPGLTKKDFDDTLQLYATGPSGDRPSKNLAEPTARQKLTGESLKAMLEAMGYNSKATKNPNESQLFIERDDWKFTITIGISPNTEFIWLNCELGQIPEQATAKVLAKLLVKSREIGPCHFNISKVDNNQLPLNLSEPITNRDVTAAHLRTKLDGFLSRIKETESLWNPKKWSKSADR